jgi:hypothetical protein
VKDAVHLSWRGAHLSRTLAGGRSLAGCDPRLNGRLAHASIRRRPRACQRSEGAPQIGAWGPSLPTEVTKRSDLLKSFADLVSVVEANEPRRIAFNGYANEEGTEVAVVQVHPDAASMELHMQVMRQHITDAYESLLEETTSIQVFGHLSEAAREMMQHLAGSGVPLSVKPAPLWRLYSPRRRLTAPGPPVQVNYALEVAAVWNGRQLPARGVLLVTEVLPSMRADSAERYLSATWLANPKANLTIPLYERVVHTPRIRK